MTRGLAGALAGVAMLAVITLALIAGDFILLGVAAVMAVALFSLGALVVVDRKMNAGLVQLFLLALAVRWLLAGIVHYIVYKSYPGVFAPDEIAYDFGAHWTALHWQGRGPNPYPYGGASVVVHLAAWCYYAFGHYPIVPKMLYGLFGAWTTVLGTMIGFRINKEIAKPLSYLLAFLPSLVLWQVLVLKDGLTLLGSMIVLASFFSLRERFRAGKLIYMAMGIALVSVTRPYEILFLAAAMGSAVLVADKSANWFRNLLAVALASIVMMILLRQVWNSPIEMEGEEGILHQVARMRVGYAEGVGSAIPHEIVDVTSIGGLLAWIPIGLLYFFLAPFPLTGTSVISLATSPEMLVWYALLPWAYKGMRHALRHHRREVLPLLMFLMVSSVGWSIAVTNVGTLYRYRAQVVFVPLLFIALHWSRRRAAAAPALVRA
jgi:hypothetical protein